MTLSKCTETAKHTPGPWEFTTKLSASENHKGFNLWGNKDGILGLWLGELSPVGDSDGNASQEGIANAMLIAAAPDLLEALEAAEALIDGTWGHGISNGYWPTISPVLVKIRAAIKKARHD